MLINQLIKKLKKFDQVIFDLDNTLFDQSDYDIGAFEDIEKKLTTLTQLPLSGLAKFLYHHKQKMGTNYPFLFNDTLVKYKLPQHFLTAMLTEYYHHNGCYIKKCNSLIPSLISIFLTKKIFIVTNGPTIVQQTKVDRLMLKDHTSEIIICDSKKSETLKPNRYAFDLIEKKHNTTSIVMVGDSMDTDGLFAKSAHIPFIHFSYIDSCHENT